MIENGLVDEVNALKESFTTSKALKTAIGYKEFIPYFNNEYTVNPSRSSISFRGCNSTRKTFVSIE